MIFIMIHLFEGYQWIMGGNLRQLQIEVCKNSLVENPFSVLGGDHNVIVTVVETMGEVGKIHSLSSTPFSVNRFDSFL